MPRFARRLLTRLRQEWLRVRQRSGIDRHFPVGLRVHGSNGSHADWTVRYRFDGSVALSRAAEGTVSRNPCLVMLHPEIPARRRLAGIPQQRRFWPALRAAAVDVFPWPADGMHVAVGEWLGRTYRFALPKEEFADWLGSCPRIVGVTVGPGTPDDAQAIEAHLNAWFTQRALRDFLGGPDEPWMRPWLVALVGWLATLLVLATAAASIQSGDLTRSLQSSVAAAEREFAPLLRRESAVNRMEGTLADLEWSLRQPETKAAETVLKALTSVPAGASLRKLEIRQQAVGLSGSGDPTASKEWLRSIGFEETAVELFELPKPGGFQGSLRPAAESLRTASAGS